MPGGKFEIELDLGATYRASFEPFVAVDVEGEIVEEPYDLEGSIFTMTIRDARRVDLFVYELEVVDDRVLIHLTPEQTAEFKPHTRYYYVIDLEWESGDVERILEGPLVGRPSVGVRQYA